MITPVSGSINFKGTVTYINKNTAAESIAQMPSEYQNTIVDGLNRLKALIENGTTDDADLVLDVYNYLQYDKKLNEYKGIVVGIGNKDDQPKYKYFRPEYFYAQVIDMSDHRHEDYVHADIDNALDNIKTKTYDRYGKEGFEKFKSFFTRKLPKTVSVNGTKEDILNKLV